MMVTIRMGFLVNYPQTKDVNYVKNSGIHRCFYANKKKNP